MFKAFLSLVSILVCGIFFQHATALDSTDIAKKGIADLRGTNLRKAVALDGEWAFVWERLLSPADTTPINTYTKFPSLWNGNTINGHPLNAQGFATYRLTVLLPTNRRPLAIFIPEFYSSYTLYVNGKSFANNGKPDSSENAYSPHWITQTLTLPANADTLNLVLQMANFSHAKGGAAKSILIGYNDLLQSDKEKWIATDFYLQAVFLWADFSFLVYTSLARTTRRCFSFPSLA